MDINRHNLLNMNQNVKIDPTVKEVIKLKKLQKIKEDELKALSKRLKLDQRNRMDLHFRYEDETQEDTFDQTL